MEEVGELARVILPFEDASGTIHRFVERNQILEESVDTILCALSIAYDLDFTDQDVEDMMKRKLEKWGELQDGEDKVADKPIPYEMHVTVHIEPERIPAFVTKCEEIGVKPIVLDLQIGSTTVVDVMTSSVHFGSNRSAYEEVRRIANDLMDGNFAVVRQKIETVPWHPASPKEPSDKMPKDCYFESHLAVVCTDLTVNMLTEVARVYDAHLSKNAFKKLDDQSYVMMVTYRAYDGTLSSFKKHLEDLKAHLELRSYQVEKEIIEFSIYDTKVSHDAHWIESDQTEK